MKYISLYPKPQLSILEQTEPRAVDSGCSLCQMAEGSKNPCVSAEGEPGGLLVVGEHPFKAEDSRNRPFVSTTGVRLRQILQKHWDGPIALDYAVKCNPPRGKRITDRVIKICRPYLSKTFIEAKPKKIITLGPVAMQSVFGRSVGQLSSRKGFGWIEDGTIPVFSLMTNDFALGNRFLTKWFEEDLRWALAQPIEKLRDMSLRSSFSCLIETEEEAIQACRTMEELSEWIAYDTETVGLLFNDDFEIVSVAVTGSGYEDAYVWSGEALKNRKITAPLLDLLTNKEIKIVAQNAKYDSNAIYSHFKAEVNGLHIDTMLVRKLLEPESQASLSAMQEIVGMGGGKEIADAAIKEILTKIKASKTITDLAEIGPLKWVKPIAEKKTAPGAYAYGLIDETIRDRYCGRDTLSTSLIAGVFRERLKKEQGLSVVWDEIIKPAAQAIEYVERWGVGVDLESINSFSDLINSKLRKVKDKLLEYEGDINMNSTREVRDFLYVKHGMPILAKTGSGEPSTDKETLDRLLESKLNSIQRHNKNISRLQKANKVGLDLCEQVGRFYTG